MHVADRAFGALPLRSPIIVVRLSHDEDLVQYRALQARMTISCTSGSYDNIVHFRLVWRDVCDVAYLPYWFSQVLRTLN
jgi:hypothetical protein